MTRRAYGFAVVLALAVGILTVAASYRYHLPLRDPDGIAGPSYIRLPLVVLIFYLLDVVPRSVIYNRGFHDLRGTVKSYTRERWTRSRIALVVVGTLSFYVVYVAYRNLKGFLPIVRYHTHYDTVLHHLDRALTFGHDPATVLHTVLGMGIAAHVLSTVYIAFLFFVPLSLGAALVWSKNVATGFWYVTALCVDWVLGAASYYWVPSLGPFVSNAKAFVDLPHTNVTSLQDDLLSSRSVYLQDPHATDSVQGVAAFASLHVAVIFTAALICWYVIPSAAVRWAMWVYFVLTTISTIYFGWHYLLDDMAGLTIGVIAVWVGAKTTGHPMRTQRALGAEGDGVIGVFPPESSPSVAGHHDPVRATSVSEGTVRARSAPDAPVRATSASDDPASGNPARDDSAPVSPA